MIKKIFLVILLIIIASTIFLYYKLNSNIDKDGTRDNTLYISKSSVRTILKQQSNKDKYIPKEDENQSQVETKNDW